MAERLSRGDIFIVSAPGEYGKPRPSVVVQQGFTEAIESVIVCPLTSDLVVSGPIRPTIGPTHDNGLRLVSQVMIEKIASVNIRRFGRKVGTMSKSDMDSIDRALGVVLGLSIRAS